MERRQLSWQRGLRQQPIGPFQQRNHDLSADAGTGVIQRFPQQRDGSAVGHHGENHHAAAVPQHRGVECQMQGMAWLLPVLDRPQHQGAIERLNVDAAVAQPALSASLSVGGQAVAQRQHAVPALETEALAEQQPGDHPAQQHQVPLSHSMAVLTQEADQLTMEPGLGIHGGLVWFRSPTLPWLPTDPIA